MSDTTGNLPAVPPPNESQENVRAKLRLLRTALKKVADACARDGVYNDEMLEIQQAMEELVASLDATLGNMRNGD
jgi:uncharacterized protein YukE